MRNSLKEHIYGCSCGPCRAVVALIEDSGAHIVFAPTRAGRLCELAVVAAAGNAGLDERDVVAARRAYAEHLGIALSGPISDSDLPIHIHHAIDNSNHNPDASNRINLGQSHASLSEGKYRLI